MKIIKRGPLVSEPWKDNATCLHCKTEVELEKADVHRTWQEKDRAYESAGFYYTWNCPVCTRQTWITGESRKRLLLVHPDLEER